MNFTIMDFSRSALSNNIFNIKIGLINAEIYTKGKDVKIDIFNSVRNQLRKLKLSLLVAIQFRYSNT